MKIIIFPNLLKKDAYSCTLEVCRRLYELGAQVCMDNLYKNEFSDLSYIKYGIFDELVKEADIAIAIGGDGTILKCATHMRDSNTELLGINTGRLGFMASVEKDTLSCLERLFTGDYKVTERMLIKAEYTGCGKTVAYHALNDIVITGKYSKIIDFDVYVNEHLTGNYLADGVVFSTPTGSTAYALSAGGPIIEPELECIEMNLLCPHSLFARPMIYSVDKVITFVHSSERNTNIYFSVDGNEPVEIKQNEKLTIQKSRCKIKLIDMTGTTFYDSLNQKLMRSLKGN